MSGYRHSGRGKYQSVTVRRRKQRQRKRLLCAVVAVAAVALIVVLISTRVRRAAEEKAIQQELAQYQDTFQPGVTINGVELTGYTYDEAQQMLTERYASNLDKEVQLVFQDRSWTFTPQQVGAQIDLESQVSAAWSYGKEGTDEERLAEMRGLIENPIDLSAVLTYDEASLDVFVQAIKQEIDCDPVSATRVIVDFEEFKFTDSSVGYRLDADGLSAQLEEIILNGGADVIELAPEVLAPNPSREELEAATVLLGECTTSLKSSSSKRNNNVNLALGYFNCLEVEPGEKISFNKLVGKRTKKNNFQEAPEYAGTTVITGVGGGVCQASTTVYGAVIRAGLQIEERHPHTMIVGYVSASQDAAVSNDDKDLVFVNNTEETLIFFAWTDARKETATVKIYGKPVDSNVRIDIVSEVRQMDIRSSEITYVEDTEGTRVWYTDDPPVFLEAGKPGMRSTAYRVYYDANTGAEINREKLSSDYYAPQNDVYLIGVHTRG